MCSVDNFFPSLSPDNYNSPATPAYNCIAWAVGGDNEKDRWWSPDPFGDYYWPEGVPREETLNAFTELFMLYGYQPCIGNSKVLESGFEKVAIYVNSAGIPTHVAKQLSSGEWTSKLGKGQDVVCNTLDCLEGEIYGFVCKILIRETT